MDEKKIRQSCVLLLEGLGLDLKDEHFQKTPDRWVRMWMNELGGSINKDVSPVLNVEFVEKGYKEMIFIRNIDFVSICPHHLVPWVGKAYVGYLPNGKITGLSKLVRLIELSAQKPQVQERFVEEVTDVLYKKLKPEGCGVIVEAKHLCVCGRGVKNVNTEMLTTALRGSFMNVSVKQEFLAHYRGRIS